MSYNEEHACNNLKGSHSVPVLLVLLFILPLGLDTLGVSISLGIKSYRTEAAVGEGTRGRFPLWLKSALLFSLAETSMPVIGLAIGFAASLVISNLMHYVGALLLVGLGLWELWEEGREYLEKRKRRKEVPRAPARDALEVGRGGVALAGALGGSMAEQFQWSRQLLLALSVSLDELAIGFSLGSITTGPVRGTMVQPLIVCLLIGIQGFLLTLVGLSLGRLLRTRLKPVKEWSELLSAVLLIGLGVWLLAT